jgi:hypothetical protein
MVDAEHGVFVDLTLMPSGQVLTARVGAEYAGSGFGLYSKIYAQDEVIVAIPLGDPAEGAVVTRRLWSASDVPPTKAADHPNDFVLVVKPDQNVRFFVTGSGSVVIDSPTIKLGSDSSDEPVPLGNVVVEALQKAIQETGVDGILSLASGCFMTSIGPAFISPAAAANIVAWGLKYLTASATNILSGKTSTER